MHVEANSQLTVDVGPFRFSIHSNHLQDAGGQVVDLRPQSARVLAVLARLPGQVVAKDDLIAEVWPDVSVTDDSLIQCITEIRRAIGDTDRRILRTFSKRGYMLQATRAEETASQVTRLTALQTSAKPVMQIAGSPGIPGASDLAALVTPFLAAFGARIVTSTACRITLTADCVSQAIALALRARIAAKAAGTPVRIALDMVPPGSGGADRLKGLTDLVAADQICATVQVRERSVDLLDGAFTDIGSLTVGSVTHNVYAVDEPGSAPRIIPLIGPGDLVPTIAVIPLAVRNPGETVAVGQIFVEDLITHLCRSQDFNVISQLSTAAFGARQTSLADIRTTLNADFVISGSFAIAGNVVSLNLELAETDSSSVLWSDRIEVPVGSIVSDVETVLRVINAIQKALVMKAIGHVRKGALDTIRAHSLLFGAIGLMHRLTVDDFMTSRSLLEMLIDNMPHHPAPLAWMARWHVLRLQQGWTEEPAQDAQAALDFAHRALDVDPENTLALTSEGIVLTNLWRRLDEAERCYNAALEINPNDANGLLLRGMLYGYQGKGSDAQRDTERALRLAPCGPHRFFFLALAAGANMVARDFPRALELSLQSRRMNRSHTSTLRGEIFARMQLGQDKEARDTARALLDLEPGFRVGNWLRTSPAAAYPIGIEIAEALRGAGIPN